MRIVLALISGTALLLLLNEPTLAKTGNILGTFSVGAGINQGTDNQADESFCLSFKERLHKWEYGLDLCMSEDRGGVGDNNFAFLWLSWIDDFHRPNWQDYGFYAGAGAGLLILSDDLVQRPFGPFILLGWDLSSQAGLEGKVGWFGENFWGTANLYWYFK